MWLPGMSDGWNRAPTTKVYLFVPNNTMFGFIRHTIPNYTPVEITHWVDITVTMVTIID